MTGERVLVTEDGEVQRVENGPGREGMAFERRDDAARSLVNPADAIQLLGVAPEPCARQVQVPQWVV